MRKIVIVEDDKTIREELKELLRNSGYQPEVLESFEHTKEDILELNPDLILLDINLPNKNGELILKEIRNESNVPIIMVTSKNTDIDEVLSMSYGADDFVTKPYNPTILLLRINAIFKRLETEVEYIQYKDLKVITKKGVILYGSQEVVLTKNEMIIFNFLISNQGRIVTRDELMTTLWNSSEYINDNTLTTNISRLRKKLEDIGYEDSIETRKGQGYILL